MAGITIELSGEELVGESAFLQLEAAVADMSELMEDFGTHLARASKNRIRNTNLSPEGTPWPTSRRVERKGGKTLFDTHRLHNSITYEAGSDFVEVGSDVIYSAVHQLGAAAGAFGYWEGIGRRVPLPFGDIPARPYLGVSDDDRLVLGELATAYFDGLLGAMT